MPAPAIGEIRRLVYGTHMGGKPYPDVEVEVISKPYSGDYKAMGQKVKIGTCVKVRILGEHQCSPGCHPPDHEIGARLDQLQ